MNRVYGQERYSSSKVEDRVEGYVSLDLMREQQGEGNRRVARILFWDAGGQFAGDTFNTEVPLPILEELIAEAKESIKTP